MHRSFASLSDWKYVTLLYVFGSAILASIGISLSSKGVPVTLSVGILLVLVLPCHLLFYGLWNSYREFVTGLPRIGFQLLRSYGIEIPESKRREAERRIREGVTSLCRDAVILVVLSIIGFKMERYVLPDLALSNGAPSFIHSIGNAIAGLLLVVLASVYFSRRLLETLRDAFLGQRSESSQPRKITLK